MHNLSGQDKRVSREDAMLTLLPQAVFEAVAGAEDELSNLSC